MAIRDLRQTHTVAELEVAALTFLDIATRLQELGYQHCFTYDAEGTVVMIDMTGIGITKVE